MPKKLSMLTYMFQLLKKEKVIADIKWESNPTAKNTENYDSKTRIQKTFVKGQPAFHTPTAF